MLLTIDQVSQFLDNANAEAPAPGVTVDSIELKLLPHFEPKGFASLLSATYVAKVSDNGNHHTATLNYFLHDGEPRFAFSCTDKFLEASGLTREDAEKRCEEASRTSSDPKKLKKAMMESFGSLPASAACAFWRNWRKTSGAALCEHTKAMLRELGAKHPNFLQNMQTVLEQVSAQAPKAASQELGLDELAFRVPVLFEGERGAGKTVTARAFARDNGYRRVELGGHEGLEAPDLLGFLVPVGQGAMVWKDGPLSEAFRSAKKQKTVLIIDEILRVRQRELSIFLTALSPDEGVYRVRTGRILCVEEGVAVEEELECPVENLCVVATTNVGSEYAVDEVDPALAERFVVLRKDTTEAQLKHVLEQVAARKKLPASVPKQCVAFFVKMTEARSRGLVRYAPTTRTLVRALDLAEDASDVVRVIRAQVLLWVARTAEGQPVPEQITAVNALIERCFKA